MLVVVRLRYYVVRVVSCSLFAVRCARCVSKVLYIGSVVVVVAYLHRCRELSVRSIQRRKKRSQASVDGASRQRFRLGSCTSGLVRGRGKERGGGKERVGGGASAYSRGRPS